MKTKLLFAVIVLFLTDMLRAQTADVTEGCANLTVNFTGPSSGPWYWDFGDGGLPSADQNPSRTFNVGTYNVTFRNTPTGPITATIPITAVAKPTIAVTASPSQGCAPLNVAFTSTVTGLPPSVNINSYSWAFGDFQSGAGANPPHTYNSVGTFVVSVSFATSMSSCDNVNTSAATITTSSPPNAGFVINTVTGDACNPPYTISITNTSTPGLSYDWKLGNGTTSTLPTPPNQTYTTNGIYTNSLTVTDGTGCSKSTSQTVSVGGPVTEFEFPSTICMGASSGPITNNSTAGNYSWNFGPGASPATSASKNPSVVFTTPGTHTISLTTFAGASCSDTYTLTTFVEDVTASFTTTPTYACEQPETFHFEGSASSPVAVWDWVLGDGTTESAQSFDHTYIVKNADSTYDERGRTTYTSTLRVTSVSGCVSPIFSFTDTIHLLWARFMPDTAEGCAPLNVTFSDSSRFDTNHPIVKWEWDYNGDAIYDTIINTSNPSFHTHTFSTPGTYSVSLVVTNDLGCTDTSYFILIHVGDLKTFDFTADQLSVCPGDPINFSVSSATDTVGVTAWHYAANGQTLSQCFQDDSPTISFNDSIGPQTITLMAEYNGCYTSVIKTDYIDVKGPIADFGYLMDCSTPLTVQFTDKSQGATSVDWDFDGDGVTDTTTTIPGITFTHAFAAKGDSTVFITATSASGCPASVDSVNLHLRTIQADFTFDTLLCKGSPYSFNGNISTDEFINCYRGYTWKFSDPLMATKTTTSSSSSFTFNTPGVQYITLVVTDVNGCKDTETKYLKIYEVKADYSISDMQICFPDTLTYTDLSVPISDTTIVSWEWSFGTGKPPYSGQTPLNQIYSTPISGSSFSTQLTVTDKLGCTASKTKTVSTYTPTSTISISPKTSICLGEAVVFNASNYTAGGSSLSYVWNLGDGITTDTTGNGINYTYTASGSYTTSLSFVEIISGCSGEATPKTVNVQDYPIASYVAQQDGVDIDNPICYFDPIVTFVDQSTYLAPSVTPTWKINGGSSISGSPITPNAFPKGTYTVELFVGTSYGCKDTTSKVWKVIGPEGTYTVDKLNICKGDVVTFQTNNDLTDVTSFIWDFGDGVVDNSQTDSVTHAYDYFPPSGNANIISRLILYGEGGACEFPVEKTISMYLVIADFTVNGDTLDTTSICLGDVTSIMNTSSTLVDNYSWTLGDGATSTSSTSINHVYTSSGIYKIDLDVTGTSANCKDTSIKYLEVFDLPVVSAIGDTVCAGLPANLLATGYNPLYTYSWLPADEMTDPAVYNPVIPSTTLSNSYTVIVTDDNSCVKTATTEVEVIQALEGKTYDTTIVIGDIIQLPISKQNSQVDFYWEPETGLSCLGCANPSVQPMEDITYTLNMKDSCTSALATFIIHVRDEVFIDLPTTFTPNNDGSNDIIYVKGWGIKELLLFEIYNRWGELVFTTNNINEGWNGYYKGMLQNNDTYVYKVRALTWRNTEAEKEGHFNLMR